MIHLFTSSRIIVEDAESLIEGTSYEFSACGSVVNISDCSNVVLMDDSCLVHFPHVEGVAVGVIVSDSKVDGLDGIEGKAH